MKPSLALLLTAAASSGFAFGQITAYTTPVGYVSQTCLANSDTIVGTPLRQPTVAAAALSADPVIASPQAVLTVAGASFGTYAGSHFVKFTSGPNSGSIFPIDANDSTTLTIDLNGATLDAVSGNTFSVTKFWTLNELFNPAVSTNDPATTGNAIVLSNTASGGNRRTELMLPDLNTANVNLASAGTYFILKGVTPDLNQWRAQGGATDAGDTQLWPDTYFTIRHRATVTANTTFTSSGEVDTGNVIIPLYTRIGTATAKRDNPRLLMRPVDVTLDELNLANTPAFITSPTASGGNRRDELMVFDNAATSFNKSSAKTYYFLGNSTPPQWRLQGGDGSNAGTAVIPSGAGFVIRKYGTDTGATVFWNNTSTY